MSCLGVIFDHCTPYCWLKLELRCSTALPGHLAWFLSSELWNWSWLITPVHHLPTQFLPTQISPGWWALNPGPHTSTVSTSFSKLCPWPLNLILGDSHWTSILAASFILTDNQGSGICLSCPPSAGDYRSVLPIRFLYWCWDWNLDFCFYSKDFIHPHL